MAPARNAVTALAHIAQLPEMKYGHMTYLCFQLTLTAIGHMGHCNQ